MLNISNITDITIAVVTADIIFAFLKHIWHITTIPKNRYKNFKAIGTSKIIWPDEETP